MKKNEAKCQTVFGHFLRQSKLTGAFELKYAGEKPLRISSVTPHQIASLLAVKRGQFHYKIPDSGVLLKLPFDCFSMYKQPASVVVFYTKFFYIIDIDNFLNYSSKSLTREQACQIAHQAIEYNPR